MTHAEESKSASGEARLSDDIQVLEGEVAQLTLERERVMKTIRELREAEDPANKIFHHEEIFTLQQDKLRLDVEIKFRTNKINRINLGMEEAGVSQGVKGGFLF
ncbi:hypothetical protein GM415_07065 [Pseudodesulfovibrio cashew]|uniref:Uncharacterized protein n=1 Tax=Pseudodesulfovibrio cashew TaxID=2678688 RepID=A0A6I6JQG2_9BACT|nr:hypothetical protein [Pseudodesulfovibrio cashew]QGY39894.1 hypothetical protein GM415_07065 [Pseudodesulfovibrio cashew]